MWQRIRRFVADMFGLYTEQNVVTAPQPIVFGLNQAEAIVSKLNNNGRHPDSNVLSAIRIAGTVLGIQDDFDDEVEEARLTAEENAAEYRALAEDYRTRAAKADARADADNQRGQQLSELAALFA